MPNISFKDYLDALKSIYGILGSIGVIIPGFVYFTNFPPPILPAISVFTAMIALAVIFLTYFYKVKKIKIKKTLFLAFSGSILLLVLYFVLFGLTTVQDPQGKQVYQIGFHQCGWSLTQEGKTVKAQYPQKTISEWMLQDALFKSGGPEIIWKKWTIEIAGVLLALIFMVSFVFWVFAWGVIAKSKIIKKNRDN